MTEPYDRRDYRSARAYAQKQADALGYDYGLELLGREWHVFLLPRRENRYGHELRCEVVSPQKLSNCKPGHGPA